MKIENLRSELTDQDLKAGLVQGRMDAESDARHKRPFAPNISSVSKIEQLAYAIRFRKLAYKLNKHIPEEVNNFIRNLLK